MLPDFCYLSIKTSSISPFKQMSNLISWIYSNVLFKENSKNITQQPRTNSVIFLTDGHGLTIYVQISCLKRRKGSIVNFCLIFLSFFCRWFNMVTHIQIGNFTKAHPDYGRQIQEKIEKITKVGFFSTNSTPSPPKTKYTFYFIPWHTTLCSSMPCSYIFFIWIID